MAKSIHHHSIDTAEMPKFDDRQIYNSAIALPIDSQAAAPGYVIRQNVRTVRSRKKTKTSNIVAVLFLIAVAALLYVGNVIAVNNLAKEVNDLNARYNQIMSTNELIKAEINRKVSLERISLMAQEKLGMTNPNEAPVWFEVETHKIEEVQERLSN